MDKSCYLCGWKRSHDFAFSFKGGTRVDLLEDDVSSDDTWKFQIRNCSLVFRFHNKSSNA